MPVPRLPARRLVGAIAASVLVLGLVGPTTTAGAAAPAPFVETIAPDATTGQQLEVYGNHFATATVLTIYLGTTVLGTTGTSSVSGAFDTTVTVPVGSLPGPNQIVATDPSTGTTATTPVVVHTDWLQDGYDAEHTGSVPGQQLLTPSNVSTLTTKWRTSFAAGGGPSGPLVSAYTSGATGVSRVTGVVLAAGGTSLAAFKTSDGVQLWRRAIPGPGSLIAAGTAGPQVIGYLLGADGRLTTFYLNDGTSLWSHDLGLGSAIEPTSISYSSRNFGTVVVTANRAGSGTGGVVAAYNAADGRLLWSFPTASRVTGAAVVDSTSYSGARVFAGTTTGKAFALSLTDGALFWSTQLPATRLEQPAVSGGTVVYGATTEFDDRPAGRVGLVAVSAATGQQQWSYDSGYGVGTATRPAVAAGAVYAGFVESGYDPERASVRAFDLRTGVSRWTYTAPAGTAWETGFTDPAVADGVVYLGSCGPNHEFLGLAAATGARLLDVNPTSCAHPATVNERVYLTDGVGVRALGLPTEVGPLAVVDDSVSGTGTERVGYSSGWLVGHTTGEYRGGDHYSYTKGSTATITFRGTGVRFWYTAASDRGIAAVSIDGGRETLVDQRSMSGPTPAAWTGPALSRGQHTVTIRVTGTRSTGSASSVITLDRVDLAH